MENMATFAYAGAIGAVHAGDFFSLFIWWEATALLQFYVLAGNTPSARNLPCVIYYQFARSIVIDWC